MRCVALFRGSVSVSPGQRFSRGEWPRIGVASIGWTILAVHFVSGFGEMLRRYARTTADFFQVGRAISSWVCDFAFISTEKRKSTIRQALRDRNSLEPAAPDLGIGE